MLSELGARLGKTFQISMDFPWQHGNLNMATDDINHKPWDIMGCHGIHVVGCHGIPTNLNKTASKPTVITCYNVINAE